MDTLLLDSSLVLSAFQITVHVLWTSDCCTLSSKFSFCSSWEL